MVWFLSYRGRKNHDFFKIAALSLTTSEANLKLSHHWRSKISFLIYLGMKQPLHKHVIFTQKYVITPIKNNIYFCQIWCWTNLLIQIRILFLEIDIVSIICYITMIYYYLFMIKKIKLIIFKKNLRFKIRSNSCD